MKLQTEMLMVNIGIKIILSFIAYHFYTLGDMFLAGLFMGWIVMEIVGLIVLAASFLSAKLWG